MPTQWITDAASLDLPIHGEHVLKPSVGAGSLVAARHDLGDPTARERATSHAQHILARGHTVMVQPFARAIEEAGETGVILSDGRLSHAIRKGVMLGPETPAAVEELCLKEAIVSREPSTAEIGLARAAVAAVPGVHGPLLYARVDMVPDSAGRPTIMELELTEPSLFMAIAPHSPVRFAQAIAARARLMAASRK